MLLKKRIAYFLCRAIICMAFIFFVTQCDAQKIRYTAQIIDFDTHQPLPNVTVQIQGKKFNAVTDSAGEFSFLLPVDSYTLLISSVGYTKLTYPIYILDKTFETIYLKRTPPNELQEVTVETIKKDAAIQNLQMSTVRINPSQLKK